MMGWSGLIAQGVLQNPLVMTLILVLAIPVVLVSVVSLVLDMRKQESRRVDDRLMGRSSRKDQRSDEDIRKSLIKKSALASAGGGTMKSLGSFRPIDHLQKACYQADLDWNAARLVVRLGLVAVGIAVILIITGMGPLRALIVSVPVFVGPIMYVFMRKRRRLYALVEQLPEVFDSIVGALRAGQSLPAAIGVVAEQLPEPSRTEFGMVYYEQNLGVRLEDALGNMRDRLNQMDVSFFVTAVQIQKSAGGDLAEVLEKIGSIIRDRIKLFGQVRVLTAEGRMSGIILLGLPPFMLLVMMVLNPVYANKLIQEPTGHQLLIVAGVMEVLGWAMIRKIISIEV
jgi:tight adherence protein B